MAKSEAEKLTEVIANAALSRAVCTVAELGIADHIDLNSPQSVSALAKATGAHEQSLYRLLRFLASHGIFQEGENRQFSHTPLSECLRTGAENSYRAGARMMHRLFPAWDALHHSVLTGEPAFQKAFGQPLFDYIGTHPDLAPIFDAGMTAIHGHETGAMLAAYDFTPIRVLADIGGGNGSLIRAVLERYPSLTGILFDLGHVIGRARQNIEAAGLTNRCSFVEGSFFESIPTGADAYLFRHIIHDWTDSQCIQILGHCRKVLPKDGRLLVVETVVPAGNEPSLAKSYDMAMLAFPGGQERTEAEYWSLFAKAGFQLTAVTPTAASISVVEGRPTES
jgi:ubiquinone/menaquinone biosynthesis C-methylase UbiE